MKGRKVGSGAKFELGSPAQHVRARALPAEISNNEWKTPENYLFTIFAF